MAFSETVAAYLAGRSISASFLVFMDFRDAPRRWWTGTGLLVAGGVEWLGMGQLISIDGLQSSIGMSAPETTFTLSGVDADIIAQAKAGSERVKDRRVRVYIQFFHVGQGVDADAPIWGNLDAPTVVWSGKMDTIRFAADGPASRSITVTAESLWTNRNRPPYGLYTDRDQNARYPGDRGLEQVASLVSKTIRWPTYVLAAGLCGLVLSGLAQSTTLGIV